MQWGRRDARCLQWPQMPILHSIAKKGKKQNNTTNQKQQTKQQNNKSKPMSLEVKALLSHRVVLEDVSASGEDFAVGAVIEALQQSGRLPSPLNTLPRKSLSLVIFQPHSNQCIVPSQAQTWSSLQVLPEDTILLLPRHEEIVQVLQHKVLLVFGKEKKGGGSRTSMHHLPFFPFLRSLPFSPFSFSPFLSFLTSHSPPSLSLPFFPS